MTTKTHTAAPADITAVQQQCRHLCANRAFKVSKRLRQLLEHLVARALSGQADTLTQRRLAVDVFGRGDDFDPEYDAIVRIEIGKLRKALASYYDTAGQRDPVRIRIPLGSYVPQFTQWSTESADSHANARIAVLPYRSLNPDLDESWLGEGLREELGSLLARIPELDVTPRHALQPLIDGKIELNRLCQELAVRFVLDGSFRLADEKLRVDAKLFDLKTGSDTWHGRYVRDLNTANLLDIQTDIAQKVVGQAADLVSGEVGRSLRSELGVDADSDFRVYEAILRFHQYLQEISDKSYQGARNALERAAGLEPENPLILSMLGDLRRAAYSQGFSDEDCDLDGIVALQRRALALRPECIPCKLSLGYSLLQARDLAALNQLTESIIGTPGTPDSYRADAAVLVALSGNWESGCALLDELIPHLPGCPPYFHYPGLLNSFSEGDYLGVLEGFDLTRPGPSFWEPMIKAATLGRLGRSSAAAEIQRLLAVRPGFAEQGRRYLSCYLAENSLIDQLAAGLRLAGLELA